MKTERVLNLKASFIGFNFLKGKILMSKKGDLSHKMAGE